LITISLVAGLVAQGLLTPRRDWRTGHLVTAAVAAAVRAVGRVHDYAANSRTYTHAALSAGFADLDILMLFVANNTYSGHGFGVNHADFAAGQAYLRVIAFFGDQLGAGA